MAAKLYLGPALTLAGKLSATGTVVPLSPQDAAHLCAALPEPVDYTFLTVIHPAGREVLRVHCVGNAVMAQRAAGAQAAPTGSCLEGRITETILRQIVVDSIVAGPGISLSYVGGKVVISRTP